MRTTRSLAFAVLIVVALALLVARVPAAPVLAADPTVYPAGMPWGKGTPWPQAVPLSVGQPWSPGIQSYAAPAVSPTPPPSAPSIQPYVAPEASAAPAQSAPSVSAPPVVASPVLAPAPVVNASPAGGSAFTALSVDGNPRGLTAGASVWYNIGSASGAGVHMDVILDSSVSADLVDLSIFAPNQLDNLARPAGRGTKSSDNANSQHWSGGGSYRVYGIWYARVTNKSGAPITIRLTSNQDSIAPKLNCESYWESLMGRPIYWTACK